MVVIQLAVTAHDLGPAHPGHIQSLAAWPSARNQLLASRSMSGRAGAVVDEAIPEPVAGQKGLDELVWKGYELNSRHNRRRRQPTPVARIEDKEPPP
jgi:hypothetical protein